MNRYVGLVIMLVVTAFLLVGCNEQIGDYSAASSISESAVINSSIKNYSANDLRRVDLAAGIGYEDNIGTARNLLMEIMMAHPLVLDEPAPSVDVLELGASTVNLAVRPWARTADYAQVRSEMLEQIKVRFGEVGISMPYPSHDVYVHQAA
jgi:small conductance mechanosensitive channel